MRQTLWVTLVFVAGCIAGAEIILLTPPKEAYDPSWTDVVLCVIVAGIFGAAALLDRGDETR